MQHSKSLGSFSSGSIALVPGQRPRARSSLDTFVIPGRTRIPSSKPEPIDIQIAESLLSTTMAPPIKESLDEMSSSERKRDAEAQRLLKTLGIQISRSQKPKEQQSVPEQQCQHSTPSTRGKESSSLYALQSRPQTLYKVRPEISKRPPPQIGGRDFIIVPPRRPRKVGRNPPPKRVGPTPPRKVTTPMGQRRGFYDGAIGSSYESRTTSMTWSTISHRIFTDSSGSFQGLEASESLEEFNRLAIQHGLPELEKCPGDEHTKTTEKTHHHNWLARKLFHRSSSTYTLKVKSNHKPMKHKKSFGMIPKLEDLNHMNILKDKNLEEICRLGGMGILALPEGFSVTQQLSLPTCLSATATYLLQHGTNNPGLFRVSGQSSTVNALHEYYAFQFVQAGSPSKVQETVGSGLLPTHIEHSVPDVASLFKKILNALPGGLLGSLELFEAFRSIFFRLSPGPELSDSDTKTLQAKLVALAISSVTSTKRISLIQAVIGLVSYFGNEAEAARKVLAADTADSGEEIQPSSELMGFQALGVVMGPLMLGALIDQLDPTLVPDKEDPTRKSFDSARKSDKKTERKQKRTSITNKLDRDATLSTHVDRANLTANIMELLLIIWKDVVGQLRELLARGSSTSFQGANKKLRGTRNGAGRRPNLGTSDEELLFVNMMKGRPLPANFSGEFKMKRKIKMERSARARGVRRASSDTPESPVTITSSGELPVSIGRPSPIPTAAICDTVRVVEASDSSTAGSPDSHTPDPSGSIHEDQRTNSEVAMAQMSMGTILPRLQDSPVTPLHKEMLRSTSQPQTPKMKPQSLKLDRSSNVTPETALRDLPKLEVNQDQVIKRSHSSFDKPLPLIGAAQRAELTPPRQGEEFHGLKATTDDFPARKSSLPSDKSIERQPYSGPYELTEPLFEPSASAKPRSRSSITTNSRMVSQTESNQATEGGSKFPERSKQGSVKVLAQHFDDAPRASTRPGSMESNAPNVYANIYALPPPKKLHRDGPFFSFGGNSLDKSLDKASRIPKPARDIGSVRRDHSCSPSPPKSPKRSPSPQKQLTPSNFLRKRPSAFNVTSDYDANPVEANSTEKSEMIESDRYSALLEGKQNAILEENGDDVASQSAEPRHNQNAIDQMIDPRPFRSPPSPPRRITSDTSHKRTNSSIYLEVAPTRPLSAYSVESLRRMHLVDEPPVAQYIPTRVISIGANASESPKTVKTTSESGLDDLKRSGSINSAMAAEIYRLKHLLEQKEKDVRETKRSLDALRDSREDSVTASGSTVGGSVSKGTLANALRTARKETVEWKRRAEWAEGRLAVIDQNRKGDAGGSMRTSEISTTRKGSSADGRPKYWFHD